MCSIQNHEQSIESQLSSHLSSQLSSQLSSHLSSQLNSHQQMLATFPLNDTPVILKLLNYCGLDFEKKENEYYIILKNVEFTLNKTEQKFEKKDSDNNLIQMFYLINLLDENGGVRTSYPVHCINDIYEFIERFT